MIGMSRLPNHVTTGARFSVWHPLQYHVIEVRGPCSSKALGVLAWQKQSVFTATTAPRPWLSHVRAQSGAHSADMYNVK